MLACTAEAPRPHSSSVDTVFSHGAQKASIPTQSLIISSFHFPLFVLLDICSPNSIMQHILRELFCLQGWCDGSLGKTLPRKPNYLRLSPRIHRKVGHRHTVLCEHHTHATHTIVTKLLIKIFKNYSMNNL